MSTHRDVGRSRGPTLGKYEIVAYLGHGGMAQVYLAVLRGLGGFNKLVVIKRLDSQDELRRGMFLDEARIAARISHPNVVDTYEIGELESSYYIAMEYLDGQPLNKIVRDARDSNRALAAPMCARIVADALAGLHHAHELADYDGTPFNVVHRDVSPHNLFVTYEGGIKVLDFGVAKVASRIATTQAGVLKGKVAYMAPEQALGGEIDRRADLFAMGLVLWELLTLTRLLARDSAAATLRAVLDESIPDLSSVLPDVPKALDAIVNKSLARHPEKRFATAQEMRAALLAYLEERDFTPDDVAKVMRERFSVARAEMTRKIHKCLRSTERRDLEETDDGVKDAVPFEDTGLSQRVPVLGSGSYGLDDGLDVTEPGVPGLRRVPATSGAAGSAVGAESEARSTDGSRAESRRSRWLALFAVVGLALVTGYRMNRSPPARPAIDDSQPASSQALPMETDTLLRLHGSNTIGSELVPALAEAFLRLKGGERITRRRGSKSHGYMLTATSTERPRAQAIEIEAEGSATAFADLAGDACDIGLSSRRIKPEEADALASKGFGDLTSPAGEHVLGLDGIAVVVHPNNPIRAVDLSRLEQVFSGDINDFASLGGAKGSINVYARDDQSGTYDTFRHLVLGDHALAPSAKRFVDSEALSDAVASDVHGIGFIGLPYVRNAKPVAVGEPGSAPLFPSTFTVATEDYSLSRRIYLYTPVSPKNPVTMDFVNFALSAEGQKIVKAIGFVDLTVSVTDSRTCEAGCTPKYLALTDHARRLSLDFRFRTGSADLDSRAQRDIDRLLTFLKEQDQPRLMLLGFSDTRGSASQNLVLARERAHKVEEELSERGVHAAVVEALGAEMPVASNANDTGRERNRRVEVWLEGPSH